MLRHTISLLAIQRRCLYEEEDSKGGSRTDNHAYGMVSATADAYSGRVKFRYNHFTFLGYEQGN